MTGWNLIKVSLLLSNCLHLCLSENKKRSDLPKDFNAREWAEWSQRVRETSKEYVNAEENTVHCECCIAVSHVLHFSFETAHKTVPKSVGKLSYVDIIDITGKQAKRQSKQFLQGTIW